MRWWGIEIFVCDSIQSQLFEPADFEESYHPFVHHRAMKADQVPSPNGVITPTYALVPAVHSPTRAVARVGECVFGAGHLDQRGRRGIRRLVGRGRGNCEYPN